MNNQNPPQKAAEAVQEARKAVDKLTHVLTVFFGELYALGRQYAIEGKPAPGYDVFYEASDLFFAEHSAEAAVILQEGFSRGYTYEAMETTGASVAEATGA